MKGFFRNAKDMIITMDFSTANQYHKSNLKKASSGIFLILSTFPILAILAVIPTYVYTIFSAIFNFSESTKEISSYIFTFAIPQILYPVITLIAALFMISFSGERINNLLKIQDVPATETFLSIGIFLGMGTVGTYISDFITQIIISLGVPIPDLTEYLSTPKTPLHFCLYVISIAVMPAICEELIFRGIICGIFKGYNKTAAIILSSIAFSFVHSTVQQIPFSFMMGLFLAYLYIKFNSLLPCIILHFINNFISCIFMLLYETISTEAYGVIVNIYDISTLLIGIICSILFIYKVKKEIKSENNHTLLNGKDFGATVVFSVPFILFTAIFLFQTITGILTYYYS